MGEVRPPKWLATEQNELNTQQARECPPWCMGAFESEPCAHHVSPSPEAGEQR